MRPPVAGAVAARGHPLDSSRPRRRHREGAQGDVGRPSIERPAQRFPALMAAPLRAASSPATGVAIVPPMRRTGQGGRHGVVIVEPLAVVLVTVASANVDFGRASGPSGDRGERQAQLRLLTMPLASVRRLLDRDEQAAAQLGAEVQSTSCGGMRAAGWPVCQGSSGVPLSCLAGVGRYPRCDWSVSRAQDRVAYSEPTTVAFRDNIGADQALCLAHPAPTLRHITCLAVVTASPPARAVLGEVTGQSCLISSPVPSLVQGRPRDG